MEERACTKCGHVFDVDITKDKVFCTNCGNLIYENNGESGYFRIFRNNSYFYSIVSLDCYINGDRVAVINNGREVVISKAFGEYEFYCKYSTSFKSKKYKLSLNKENNIVRINVYPGFFNPLVKINDSVTYKDKLKFWLMYIFYLIIVFIVVFGVIFLISM
jgi:hypothetical protein